MPLSACLDISGNAIYVDGFMLVDGSSLGLFRFLVDHDVSGEIIKKGEERYMYSNNWSITPDVEPLDEDALNSFYAAGPKLGACIRTQWQGEFMLKPITFWYQVAPQVWALSGLGSDQGDFPPINLNTQRVEDKQG